MTIVTTELHDQVALVRFDRGGKANALNAALIEALSATAADLAGRHDVAAVVLTGTPRIFAAGVDLKDQALWQSGGDDLARSRAMAAGGRMVESWRRLPQPVIAAIEGPAIGGGAILALAADFRVMAASALLRLPEIKLGMTLGWGGLPLLVEQLGAARAKRLLFDDETITSAEALILGLADRQAEDGAAVQLALDWAQTLSMVPALALRMTKAAIDGQARQNWAAATEAEQFYLARRILEAEAG